MPWKLCRICREISYSASTHYEAWPCPHCGAELKDEPEYDMEEAKAAKGRTSYERPAKAILSNKPSGQ